MFKILVVEDNSSWADIIQRGLERGLGDKVKVLHASTIEEAESIFHQHSDLSIVLMDACVPGERPTTLGLVRNIRETFKGPMVAMSSRPDYREQLVKAGCDHESGKDEVVKKALDLAAKM